jgi:DNA-binding response OmpR family regulator
MPKRVLVCDNEEVLRQLVRTTLEDKYDVDEARNADEALACARESRPDAILLDLMMPGRSGLDVLRELRADADLASIKVVMLTARVEPDNMAATLAFGADRFIAKPFSPRRLLGTIDELLEDRLP